MPLTHFFTLWLTLATSAFAQRPFFAGTRPIGYPQVVINRTTSADGLVDRFGEAVSTTTQRLPIEALGDRDLVDRLSKLPIDKQPFWLINWQALEAHRQNPQTYPQRPSQFAQPFDPNPSTLIANSNSAGTVINSASESSSSPISSTNSPNSSVNQSLPLENRNSDPISTEELDKNIQATWELQEMLFMITKNDSTIPAQTKNESAPTIPNDNNIGNPANGKSNSTKDEPRIGASNSAVNADGIEDSKTGVSDSVSGKTNVTKSPTTSSSTHVSSANPYDESSLSEEIDESSGD